MGTQKHGNAKPGKRPHLWAWYIIFFSFRTTTDFAKYISSADIYEGEMLNGLRHGQGFLNKQDRSRYEGSFVNGLEHGQGVLFGEDGSRYEGGFVNGLKHGQGTLRRQNGPRYEGSFVNGLEHGQGVLFGEDGSRYEGGFVNGLQHGQGTIYREGSRQVSSWMNGREQGDVDKEGGTQDQSSKGKTNGDDPLGSILH